MLTTPAQDENAVEAALLYNDNKYPPLLPRKLRVVRAKKPTKQPARVNEARSKPSSNGKPEDQSLRGRAKKLLGRAGAATMGSETGIKRQAGGGPNSSGANSMGLGAAGIKNPEAFVFEGHRASSTQGNRGLRLGGKGGKKKGKPKTRSANRGAAWKTKGAK